MKRETIKTKINMPQIIMMTGGMDGETVSS
jgi:hypothetical protein